MPDAAPPPLTLLQLFVRFLRFGVLAWGGPVAQIAMLRQELVDEERWVEPERFNRVLALYQAMPGPEAAELCIWFGMRARGRIGGLVAGLGFILPGATVVLAVAWAYVHVGIGSTAAAALAGVQVAAVALVARAVHRIGGHALHDRMLFAIAVAAAVATLGGLHFAIVLVAGALAAELAARRSLVPVAATLLVLLAAAPFAAAALRDEQVERTARVVTEAPNAGDGSPSAIARAGLIAGSLSFGGAYTSIGFVRQDAVVEQGWLTDTQFLDSVALAGALPAPLVVFTTFVGYLSGGLLGALAMTVGVFLPAFAITLVGHRALERVVDEPRVHRALDGITAAVVGLIAVTALALARTAIDDVPSAAMLIGALVVLATWTSRASIVVVVTACGLAGVLLLG
jgi:chromate transporter